jgi:hypothetical protein
MTIAEARDKCKNLIAKVPRDALILAILIVASSLSFGLGYLAGLDAQVPTDASLQNPEQNIICRRVPVLNAFLMQIKCGLYLSQPRVWPVILLQ